LNDFETLEQVLGQFGENQFIIPFIKSEHSAKQRIFSLGAYDYITCPIIPAELLVRIKSCVHLYLAKEKNTLEKKSIAFHKKIEKKTDSEIIYTEHSKDKNIALVRKTCRYLLTNLTENNSLNEVSRLMTSNRNTLSSSFKKVLGIGVFAWLREQRMQKSATLLTTTNLTVQQICYEVGYNDPANFSTLFKAHFAIAPQQYRIKMTDSKVLGTHTNA